jgi:hypothetical protein
MRQTLRFTNFTRAAGPIQDPVTKFGGLPVWVDTPQWPNSRSTGKPMQFLAQVAVEEPARVVYLFATWGWDADNSQPGESAAIVQQKSAERATVIIDGPQCEDYFVDEELAVESRVFEAVATAVEVPAMRDVRAPDGHSLLFRLEETIEFEGAEMRPWILFGRGLCDVYLSEDGLSAIARMLA